MLDVDHGTYPFVTSSNATAGGACTGSGIPPTRIDRVVAVVKAYTTRVGEGPFPTELLDADGERLRERRRRVRHHDRAAAALRLVRRAVARYAPRINGVTDFVLTKLDVLTGFERLPVCVAYDVDGVRHDEMPMTQTEFHHARPVYEHLEGWSEDIAGVRAFEDLPKAAQALRAGPRGAVGAADLGHRRRPGPGRHHRPARPARLGSSHVVAPPREGRRGDRRARRRRPARGVRSVVGVVVVRVVVGRAVRCLVVRRRLGGDDRLRRACLVRPPRRPAADAGAGEGAERDEWREERALRRERHRPGRGHHRPRPAPAGQRRGLGVVQARDAAARDRPQG